MFLTFAAFVELSSVAKAAMDEGLQLVDFHEWSGGGGGVVAGRDSVFFFAGESSIWS
jgi:hypothetical protein